ncbi:FAD-binding oxidoreductase [Bradyrhizobium sp. JYMT SZCCT0428]|uniref:FAD-binding oxidoreductase n=1 Tax=Bradyrhizobium sp. JYMT SZCCT0428 TaxID=2807673 RepID=UPI001BAC81F6|nr:FAD-binding oxidoreductase [Bradyrhizobium sp. JYMT SZCCT0428]MBR1152064.1 FAD-binding oxidoreductase [Bradyrhizobium sp. JYMT SZCCT0428]
MQPAIIGELRAAFDATTVLTGADIDARYYTDIAGIPVPPPLAVMRPRSTEDVSRFLAICHRARVAVTTQGGMTGLVGATMPMAGEIVLSMERMNAIEEVDTGGGVVIAQAAVPLQRVHERVAQDGFMYPLDLGARGSCTIGGNISTNAGGNRVIRYGMTRDLVLGLEAVLADGTVLKGVRKYIKNNTGTDLKQLFIGTEGTLGVVTRAALRIFPAPAEQQVVLCALPSFDKVRAMLDLARKRLGGELTAFEVMWNSYYRLVTQLVRGVAAPLPATHPFYLLMESSGSNAERLRADVESLLEEALGEGIILDAIIANSGASTASIWRVRDSSVELSRATAPTVGFDISLAIDQMEPFTEAVAKAIKAVDKDAYTIVLGHVGDGNLHVNTKYSPPADKHEEMKKLVFGLTSEFGGSISAEHGIGISRRPYLKLSRTAEEIETMRTLKRALDPHHILNPGRVFEM